MSRNKKRKSSEMPRHMRQLPGNNPITGVQLKHGTLPSTIEESCGVETQHPRLSIAQTDQNLELYTLWQFGDWIHLAQLNTQQYTSEEHIAIKASAQLQLGEIEEAQRTLKGIPVPSSEQTARLLVSGVFNTLGKARAILGETQQAEMHFTQSIEMGLSGKNTTHSIKARKIEQLSQIGIITGWSYKEQSKKTKAYEPEILKKIDLGDAWAGNSINTVIFRHHAIFTAEKNQYMAFYVDNKTLRVIKRCLQINTIEQSDIAGEYNLKDAHNSISLGIDRAGHIHICYDHHGNQLNYRRSLQPHDINGWTDQLPMTGKNEQKVTYPTFILPHNHSPLLILYRDGNWKQGTAYLKYYDEALQSWFDYPNSILSGSNNKPWTSNPYWNHPVMDQDGCLHLSFTWRIDYYSEEQLITNLNIDYAKTHDNGFNWFTSQDQPYKLPITQVNSETVWPIAPGSNHINQTSMALDSKGYPHIVFYANDSQKIPQYQHLWFNGTQWRCKIISNHQTTFKLAGGGTLKIPISRPEIVIDSNDNVIVIHRGSETQQKLTATILQIPEYDFAPEQQYTLWGESVGQAEPIIDRIRWQQEQVLTLLVQNNDQPDGDIAHKNIFQPILLIDITFVVEK
jgi:hypothetical protein